MRKVFLFFCFLLMAAADTSVDEEKISKTIIDLHTQQGPGNAHVIWRECGKKLAGEKAVTRAGEYAKYIAASIEDVRLKYAEEINPDHVVAILYRESSNDECAIGRKEIGELFGRTGEPVTKARIRKWMREWSKVHGAAKKACGGGGGRSVSLDCLDKEVAKKNPAFRGIHGWDLGASQFRWPGSQTRKRSVRLPSGKSISRVTISDLMKAEVSIQMLVEDLAMHKKACRSHKHWYRKRGKGNKIYLSTEESYFVHHHTGDRVWSERYWKRVRRHLVQIEKNRSKGSVAKISSRHVL